MLKLIYGTAGSGKTYEARRIAAQCAREGREAVMLVPEQYSFETERAMLLSLGAHDARLVKVLSFRRLAELLTETGNIIDDCARAALMSVALGNVSDFIDLYSRKKKNIDFVSHMLDALKELKICAISPDEMEKASSKVKSNILSVKMRELAIVCAEYDRLASQAGLDPLDSLTRLEEYLRENDCFKGKTVIIDSFRGFTGQEMKVISQLIRQSDECVITLCTDGKNSSSPTDIFSSVNKTANRFISEAKKHFKEVKAPVVLSENKRFSSDALKYMEKGIYRQSAESYEGEAPQVVIYKAEDSQDEARFVCREIRRLLREEGCRCRDIAVLARAQEDYARPISEEASAQGIPLFMDRRSSIEYSPLIRFVGMAVNMAKGAWRGEDILRSLKCFMIDGIDDEDIFLTEDYQMIWGLKGQAWKSPFTADPDGFGSEMNEEKEERLKRINAVRERVVGLLEPFCEKLRDATARQRARCIYELLDNAGSAEKVRDMCVNLPDEDSKAQSQVWDVLMNILDKLAVITGDVKQSIGEFSDLLSLMFSAATVGQIPQGVDEVTFGAADRVRTSEPRAVFIVGAAQGVFPAAGGGAGVFTDSERRELIGIDILVTEPSEAQTLEERLLAYNALCGASEKVYITYPSANGNEAKEPSEIITQIKKILPNCVKKSSGGQLSTDMIESGDAAFELAVTYGEKNEVGASLNALLMNDERYGAKLKALNKTERDMDITDKAVALELFGENMRLSQAKTEAFFECPFKFFCNYALKVRPRRKARLDPIEYGNVLHFVMENIVRKHCNELTEYSRSDDLEVDIKSLIDEYTEKNMGGAEDKSSRFTASIDRMVYAIKEVVKNLGDEMEISLFRPEPDGIELEVGRQIPSPKLLLESGSVSVVGKIDRIDSWQGSAGKYIRVIDYKTGEKSFDLSSVLQGLGMQMFIYLDILEHSGMYENFKGAGVLYSPAAVDAETASRYADGETSRRKRLKRKGLLTDDLEALNAMEQGLGYQFIPVKLTSSGGFYAWSSVASEKLIRAVCKRTRENLIKMGNSLHEGKTAPYPVYGSVKACSYCDYKGICGVEDERESGHELVKMSMEQIEEELFGKEEG